MRKTMRKKKKSFGFELRRLFCGERVTLSRYIAGLADLTFLLSAAPLPFFLFRHPTNSDGEEM